MSVWERHLDDLDLTTTVSERAPTPTTALTPAVPRIAVPRLCLRYRLVAIDVLALGAAFGAALLSRPGRAAADVLVVAVAAGAGVLSARAQGLYSTWVNSMRAVVLARLLRTAAVAAIAAVAAAALADRVRATGLAAAVGAAAAFSLLALGRMSFDWWLARERAAGRYHRPTLLVGTSAEVRRLMDFVDTRTELGHRVIGWVGPDDGGGAPGRLGSIDDAVARAAAGGASGAVVLTDGLDRRATSDVIRRLVGAGLHVSVGTGLDGISYRRLVTVPMGHEPFVHVAPLTTSSGRLAAKRALDVVGAAFLLVITAPLLCLAAIGIKRCDGGPVLFRQTRVGHHGKPIVVHKLRTMEVDAEAKVDDLSRANERAGPLFKLARDPRVTPIGEFLRRTSIDELPQLFDVLRGDMSLVGPRPALPSEVARFDDELLGRHRVRPGVTGLWQVEGRDKQSFDVYRQLDLFYVDNWSLALDVAILLDTVPAILARGVSIRRPTARPEQAKPVNLDVAS